MRRYLAPLLVAIAGVAWVVVFLRLQGNHLPDVAWIDTPQDVVEAMLELAEVRKTDTVYDLGCGDGRIVVTAARKYGCRAKGIDIDSEAVRESRANAERNGVQDRVIIQEGDIFKLDLREATVITIYLKPHLNTQLIPQLDKLGPGVRIVSHKWSMPGAKPRQVNQIKSGEDQMEHPVYLWVTPLEHTPSADPDWGVPFAYDDPPWNITAIAFAVSVAVLLVLTRFRSTLLAAGIGAVTMAGLAWWALGHGEGYMVQTVQLMCSSIFAVVGACSGWVAASLRKARPKPLLSGPPAPDESAGINPPTAACSANTQTGRAPSDRSSP
jgi:SAM-dependent methyltransferase